MVKTNGFRQFLILLYKGLLVRKRHYIVTFFEIVIPIFIASIPCIIESEMSSPQTNYFDFRNTKTVMSNYTTFKPFDPFYSTSNSRYDMQFLFTPSNALTDKFMNDSIKMFQSKTNYKGSITSKGFKSEKELVNDSLYKKKDTARLIIIGTVFHGFENKLPSSLDYKIRYSDEFYGPSFSTNLKYRVNGPHYTNDYINSFFLSWQASVEETFIQKKMIEQNKIVDYKVWMQKFPYPEYRDTSIGFSVINLVPWVLCYGYLIFIINIVRRVIEEKTNGSKELLKMMGMTDCTYWTSTFMNYFIIALITMFITTIIYKVPMKNAVVFLKHTNFVLLFIILSLFMASLILFCLAFSIFFNRPVLAIIALLVIYILSFTLLMTKYFLLNHLNYFPLSVPIKLSICLLPPGALITSFYFISFYEGSGDGLQFGNITEFVLVPDLNFLMVIAATFFSCLLYIIAIWYFDAVWPWQPGVPRPFYFLFTRSYWCGAKRDDAEEMKLVKNENSSEFFEEEPIGSTPGVVIKNLSKEFRTGLSSKLAVNDLTLNIYQGQITALLGHNGAGKTTTINILTGLYTPTSGTASIHGLDILTETTRARRGLGVCPQHNVLYDTLTVEEHLKIYAAMKGVQWKNLESEISNILNILKLSDKRYELAKNLSGGMKRKLSLGIAIIGDSKVLVLDEPTSGMDIEARRSVWDALLEIRHSRTIILTTHYMEEADILGDRIAIMAEGEVQCCGSPLFLKQKFGTGYHLHVVKDSYFNVHGVISLLQKYIPQVSIGNELENEISFSLSSENSSRFGNMFEELEIQKSKLGVTSFGITITTMEDVFLNVSNISEVKYKLQYSKETQNDDSGEIDDVFGDSPGLKPHPNPLNQFIALLIKRFHYSKRHWSIFIAQVAIPFIIICLCLYSINSQNSTYRFEYDPINLNIFSVYGETGGFYYNERPLLSKFSETFKNVLESNRINVEKVSEPTHYVLNKGKKDIAFYLKSFLVGGAVEQHPNGTWNLTAWYNGEPYHASPMSLLLMHTAILQYITNTGSISLVNDPLPEPRFIIGENTLLVRIMAIVFVPLAFGFVSASFTLVPIHERATKAKLLQLMSGIPAAMYWISMFLWDFLIHFIICIVMIIPFAIFASYAFFGIHSEAIGIALLLMLLYGWASIPFSYLVSLVFKKGSTGFSTIVGICAIIGVGVGSILKVIEILFTPYVEDLRKVNQAVWAFRIFPTFSFASGISSLFGTAFENAICEALPPEDLEFNCQSPTMNIHNPLFKCCRELCGDHCLKPTYPIQWDMHFCGRDILFLCIDGIIYFALLLLFETRIMATFWRIIKFHFQKIRRRVVGQVIQDTICEDSDVYEEEERIKNLTEIHPGSAGEALVTVDLTKVYKNFYAVNHLTFGIHQEECFGLLGVNGAGKTTTFRMLTGDCYPTEGNAIIQNCSFKTNVKKFQSFLGYCPQFDALIDRLSGREMLTLFARLRGLTGSDLEERVDKLIKMTDLTKHADKQTQFYSGGNKRKLSIAIALVGSPPLILLDEPTAGVDPVSRRKIWNILSQARNNTGAAVLLTTHNMEECEALCNRLAIMVNGRFRCLGSIQHLKTKYGQGYSLIIKLKREDQNDHVSMEAIKKHVQTHLRGANLKDDHQGMLQYHVVDPSITLSRLFKFMANMKTEFELEDYLISDTSLEQIFLTFARAQRI